MKKVLIVEDDLDIVELLTIHLKDLDCEITATHDGLDGLEQAIKHKFDLIILDIMLPKMDGLEVCRELRPQVTHRLTTNLLTTVLLYF